MSSSVRHLDETPLERATRLERKVEEYERWFKTLDAHLRSLERERQKLAAVMNQSDAAFLVVDADLRVRWVNGVFVRQCGDPNVTGGMLLGSPCHQVLCGQDDPCESCPAAQPFATGVVAHHELRLKMAGVERHVYASAMPVKSPEGKVVESLVMLQDVSDLQVLKRSGEELHRKSEQLQALAEALASFLEKGDCGEATRRLLRAAQRQSESEFGVAAVLLDDDACRLVVERTDGTGSDRTLSARELQAEDSEALAALREGIPVQTQDFLSVPLKVEGEVLGTIAVGGRAGGYGDEQRQRLEILAQMACVLYRSWRQHVRHERLEEELRQSQKMDAIGRLAGGLAHDFNNLLTGISCYAEFLIRDTDAADTRHAHASEIAKAAERAAALTQQLLAFSRKQVVAPRRFGLDAEVSELEPMLRRLIGEDITLETTLRSSPWAVEADPAQMQQVLLNLAVNARDAMGGGGRLAIQTAAVSFDERSSARVELAPGSYVMLAVRDTGVGMDADTRARIFEPFFTTKEVGKGTGLGLSLVYGIVKQAGGAVRVESEPGCGSTFRVYLPAFEDREAADSDAARESSSAHVAGGETVLLVEDEPLVRSAARGILAGRGFRVIEASCGDEALAVAARESGTIDLLLTDVVMPGMNGRELAERFAAIRPEMRVLFMSGYADDRVLRHGVATADLAFLAKPFRPEVLVARVREALGAAVKA